ncbi:hypothetical protein niasHT_020389 [Heterodera trifolii]|uniref:Uncharacterized protein n=1 Tax=Heterodera trifolii TaxID=157864 RepID=A0ABD2JXC5_9BILA
MPIRQALGFQLSTGATHAHSNCSTRVMHVSLAATAQPAEPVHLSHALRLSEAIVRQALGFQLSTGATHAHSNWSRVPRMPIRQALGFQLSTGATHAHSNCSTRVMHVSLAATAQPAEPVHLSHALRLSEAIVRQALGFQLSTGATHAHSNWSRVPRMPIRQALGFQLSTGATHAHSNCSTRVMHVSLAATAQPAEPVHLSHALRLSEAIVRQALGFQLSTGATHAHSNWSRVPRMPIRQALGFQLSTGATHAHSNCSTRATHVPVHVQSRQGAGAKRLPLEACERGAERSGATSEYAEQAPTDAAARTSSHASFVSCYCPASRLLLH